LKKRFTLLDALSYAVAISCMFIVYDVVHKSYRSDNVDTALSNAILSRDSRIDNLEKRVFSLEEHLKNHYEHNSSK